MVLRSEWMDYRERVTVLNSKGKMWICEDFLEEYFTFPGGTTSIRLSLHRKNIKDSCKIYLKAVGAINEVWFTKWCWTLEYACGEVILQALENDLLRANILEVNKWERFYLKIECR